MTLKINKSEKNANFKITYANLDTEKEKRDFR